MIAVDQYLQQRCGYIGSIFDSSQPRFMLPNLQRSYKWNKSHITVLWTDLNDYRQVNHLTQSFDYGQKNPEFNNTPPYLLGTIYVTESKDAQTEKVRQLIDGQQRLTTISISVLVFKELYKKLTSDKEINRELKSLDGRLDYSVAELFANAEKILVDRKSPNLIYPQATNNEFWTRLCLSRELTDFQKNLKNYDKDSETQKNIVAAFDITRSCISDVLNYDDFHKGENIEWIKTTKKRQGKWDISGVKKLVEKHDTRGFEEVIINFAGLLATLLDCVCLVQFTCTSEQQVSLFDIINNRGEPFDMPDMVRLMLFSHTNKTQHKELNRIWTESKVEHNLLSWVWNAFYADPNNIARNKLQFQIEQELDKQTPSQASQ